MQFSWLAVLFALSLPALASPLGPQRTLVLPIVFADSTYDESETEAMVGEANRLLLANSGGQTWLEAVYAAPYRPTHPASCYRGAEGLRRLRTEALAAQPRVRVPRLVLVVPAEYEGQPSLGTIGSDLVRCHQTEWYASTAWVRPFGSPADWGRVLAHELGHNFGFWHAQDNYCQDSGDLMGSDHGQLFSAAWRAEAGWLPRARVTTVEETGEFPLHPAEGQSGPQALYLPRPGGEGYWVEYRAASGEVQVRERLAGAGGTTRLPDVTADRELVTERGHRLRLVRQGASGVILQVVVPTGATALK